MSKQQLNWLVGVTTSTCIRVYVLNTFIAFRDRHDILHSTDIEKKKQLFFIWVVLSLSLMAKNI